jgi:enoyl-[acyl-carrier-protein] reductase (NADH)
LEDHPERRKYILKLRTQGGFVMKALIAFFSMKGQTIAPGIIVTPLAVDEFNGPRGDFYKNMFAKCPAGRPGTADEMANIAELLMSDAGAFITGSTFLADGGATASYYYGPLQP